MHNQGGQNPSGRGQDECFSGAPRSPDPPLIFSVYRFSRQIYDLRRSMGFREFACKTGGALARLRIDVLAGLMYRAATRC